MSRRAGPKIVVDQLLKPGAVDVVSLVSRNDLDIGHQECRVEPGIGDPARDIAAGDADLVQNIAMGRDDRMIGLAAQDIDDAACLIPLLVLIGEERACGRFNNPSAGGVLLQRLLQGVHEQVALRPMSKDHPKAGVYIAVLVGEWLLHRRDVGFLAAQDVEPAGRDLGLALEPPGLPHARAKFLLNLVEQRLKRPKSWYFWRLAISSAARFSAAERT
jgi:hypothetical protein